MRGPTGLRGLIVPLVTPLDGAGRLDEKSLGRLVDLVVPHAGGILMGSLVAGEGAALTGDERRRLILAAARLVGGLGQRILVEVTGASSEETAGLAAWAMEEIGGDCILVDTPLRYRSNRGLSAHYERLGSGNALLLVWNDPRVIREIGKPFKRLNIRTANVKRLTGNPCVIGLVQSGDLKRTRNYARAMAGRSDFMLFDGEESSFLSFPSTGGVLAATANVLPGTWCRVVRQSLEAADDGEGDPGKERRLWEDMNRAREVSALCSGKGPALIKAVLAEMGVITSARTLAGAVPRKQEAARIHSLVRDARENGSIA